MQFPSACLEGDLLLVITSMPDVYLKNFVLLSQSHSDKGKINECDIMQPC